MAKAKKLTESNILGFLDSNIMDSGKHDDPISAQKIIVTLDQLQPYELNPRRTRNPKYDDIKASIESVGLIETPNITRRDPDDEKYSIRDGGNTRLEILNELYLKYKNLAEKEVDDSVTEDLLQKADSFYRISCLFVPFKDDLNALSTHMIENEERGGTIFIERALVVDRYRELFKEIDKQAAEKTGSEFNDKPLSSRVLSDRISSYGWQVNQSHIVRYNYTATILIKYIPDALWAGSGEPLIRKISALFKAYDIFWKATTQGDEDPDKIEALFYDTLKEFDAEKIDIDAFKQDLDILLSDLTGIDATNLMFEISSIMSNSDQSLKYKPNALKENQETLKEREQSLSTESESSKQLPHKNSSDVAITDVPLSRSTSVSDTVSPSSNEGEDNKAAKTQGSPSHDLKLVETTSHHSTEPKTLESLIDELCNQAKTVENLSPRALGLSISEPVKDIKINFYDSHIYYEMMDFFDDTKFPQPQSGTPEDDIASMIWWQLVKYSRLYNDPDFSYTEAIMHCLPTYIISSQAKNKKNHILEVILEWENNLLLYPDILKECQKLQSIQSELTQFIQSNHQLSQ